LAGFVVTVLLLGTKWKVIALSTAGAGLGAWAVMTVLWRNDGENPPAISAARLYLVIGLVYGALSLGPEVIFKGHKIGDGPWMMIAGIPGYGTVRTPSRFFLVTVLSASAMASMGAAWIASAIGRPRWSTVFSLAVISLVLLEEWSSPVPVRRMPGMSEAPGAYWWMAAQHDRGVLLEVPLCPGTQYGRERMLFSNLHRHPVVDSESSFLPPVMGWLDRDRLKDGGAIPYLEKLRTIGLRYVIVHHEGVRSGEIRAIIRTLERSGATKAADFGLDEIYVYPAAGVAPGPFQKNNAAASISAGLAGDGSGLQARAALKNLTGSPIFERKARKLTVEAEIHATDGSRSVKKAGIWFAPPLFAPGETQQRRVEIEVPAATQGFGYHLRLVDESGETWAEGAGRVDGASGKGGS
jgi:hypothetical protein